MGKLFSGNNERDFMYRQEQKNVNTHFSMEMNEQKSVCKQENMLIFGHALRYICQRLYLLGISVAHTLCVCQKQAIPNKGPEKQQQQNWSRKMCGLNGNLFLNEKTNI